MSVSSPDWLNIFNLRKLLRTYYSCLRIASAIIRRVCNSELAAGSLYNSTVIVKAATRDLISTCKSVEQSYRKYTPFRFLDRELLFFVTEFLVQLLAGRSRSDLVHFSSDPAFPSSYGVLLIDVLEWLLLEVLVLFGSWV